MITITHAVLSCAEWTEGKGVTKELWEVSDADTGVDMGLANIKLENLLRSVASDLDYATNLGGGPVTNLWPDLRSLDGWHNDVTDEEPHRWCSAWSLPIKGEQDENGNDVATKRVFCLDLWLAGPGCTGKPDSSSPVQFSLDAQDPESAFLKWPDGYDRMVLRTVDNPGCQPMTQDEVQAVFNLIDAAPRMRQEMQEALRWLREHAGYMSNEVREGYTATCDGLEATIESIHPKKGTK
jgi:hypothetical protein